MPKSKNALKRKIEKFENRRAYYQSKKIVVGLQEFYHYLFGEQAMLNKFSRPLDRINENAPDKGKYDHIPGIDVTNETIADDDMKKLESMMKKHAKTVSDGMRNVDSVVSRSMKATVYLYDPSKGDTIRAIIQNPSLRNIMVTLGTGPTFFKYDMQGNPLLNDDVLVQGLGLPIINAFNDYYENLQKLVEMEYRRQQDIDNNLDKINEETYKAEYIQVINNFVTSFNNLAQKQREALDENGRPKEFNDFLQNGMSETTCVNIGEMRQDIYSAVKGVQARIKGLENGWGIDELSVFNYLGENKASIEIARRKLQYETDDMNEMAEGEEKEEKRARIESKQQELGTFEADFNRIYNEVYNRPVTNRRDKIRIVNSLIEFERAHHGMTGHYSMDGNKHNSTLEATKDNILDPYGMQGSTKEQQLSDIMESLNEVDGASQSSSPNFKALRKKLEELYKLSQQYPGDMNREQLDEYFTKVLEVKAAAKTYLKGKQDEADRYRQRHHGNEITRKEITKKRMNFVMGLAEKMDCHLENSVGRFPEDVSLNDKERNIATLARLIRVEARARKDMTPEKRVTSVLKSMYFEQLRTKYANDPGFTNENLENALTEESIDHSVETLTQKLNNLGIMQKLTEEVGLKSGHNHKKFDHGYVVNFIEKAMRMANENTNPGMQLERQNLLASFGYENRVMPENAPAEDAEKYGFGRYLNYVDRNPQTGISETEQLELKTGIIKKAETAPVKLYEGSIFGVNGDFTGRYSERDFDTQAETAVKESSFVLGLIAPELKEKLNADYTAYADAKAKNSKDLKSHKETLYKTMVSCSNAVKTYTDGYDPESNRRAIAEFYTHELDTSKGDYNLVNERAPFLPVIKDILKRMSKGETHKRNDGVLELDYNETAASHNDYFGTSIKAYNELFELEYERQKHDREGWNRENTENFTNRYRAALLRMRMNLLMLQLDSRSQDPRIKTVTDDLVTRKLALDNGWQMGELNVIMHIKEIKDDLAEQRKKYNQQGLNELNEGLSQLRTRKNQLTAQLNNNTNVRQNNTDHVIPETQAAIRENNNRLRELRRNEGQNAREITRLTRENTTLTNRLNEARTFNRNFERTQRDLQSRIDETQRVYDVRRQEQTEYERKFAKVNNLHRIFEEKFGNPDVFRMKINTQADKKAVFSKIDAFRHDSIPIEYPKNIPYIVKFNDSWEKTEQTIKQSKSGIDYEFLGTEATRMESYRDIYGPVPKHHPKWESGSVISANRFNNTLYPMENADSLPFNEMEIVALGIGANVGAEARNYYDSVNKDGNFEGNLMTWTTDYSAHLDSPRQNMGQGIFMTAHGREKAYEAMQQYSQGNNEAVVGMILDGMKFLVSDMFTGAAVHDYAAFNYSVLKSYGDMLRKDPLLKQKYEELNNRLPEEERVSEEMTEKVLAFNSYVVKSNNAGRLLNNSIQKTGRALSEGEKIKCMKDIANEKILNQMIRTSRLRGEVIPEYADRVAELQANPPMNLIEEMGILQKRYIKTPGSILYTLTPEGKKELDAQSDYLVKKYGSEPGRFVNKSDDTIDMEMQAFHFRMENKYILSQLAKGNLSEEQMREYTKNYIINNFMEKASLDSVTKGDEPFVNLTAIHRNRTHPKRKAFENAVGEFVGDMDFSKMSAAELKDMLEAGTKPLVKGGNSYFIEMTTNIRADVELRQGLKDKYTEEYNRVDTMINRLTNIKEASDDPDTREILQGILNSSVQLRQKIETAKNNPDATFDGRAYLRDKKALTDRIRAYDNEDLNIICDNAEGRKFKKAAEKLDDARRGVYGGSQEFKKIMEDLKKFDEEVYKADQEFLKTGNYPSKDLREKAKKLIERAEAYKKRKDDELEPSKREAGERAERQFNSTTEVTMRNAAGGIDPKTLESNIRDARRLARNTAEEAVTRDPKTQKRYDAMDIASIRLREFADENYHIATLNKEIRKNAKMYRDYSKVISERKQEAQEEVQFRNRPEILDFETKLFLKPGVTAEAALDEMIRQEVIVRKALVTGNDVQDVADNLNNAGVQKKLLSSACRSLYMEVLKDHYKFTPEAVPENADPAEQRRIQESNERKQQENEQKFRSAISFGFKDRNNIEQFSNLIRNGSFGENFKQGLINLARKKESITHEDILGLRDSALEMAFGKAKLGSAEAENLKKLAKSLGSKVLPAPAKAGPEIQDNNGVRNFDIIKDYSKKPAPVKANNRK